MLHRLFLIIAAFSLFISPAFAEGNHKTKTEADLLKRSDTCRENGQRWTGSACEDRSHLTGLWSTKAWKWKDRALTIIEDDGKIYVRVDDLSEEGIFQGSTTDRMKADREKWRVARPLGSGVWEVDAKTWGYESVNGLKRKSIAKIFLSLESKGSGTNTKPDRLVLTTDTHFVPGYIYQRDHGVADIMASDWIDLSSGIVVQRNVDLDLTLPAPVSLTFQYRPATAKGPLIQSRSALTVEAVDSGLKVNGWFVPVQTPADDRSWLTVAVVSRGVFTRVFVLSDPTAPMAKPVVVNDALAFAPGGPLRFGYDGFNHSNRGSGLIRHVGIWRIDLSETMIRRIAQGRLAPHDPLRQHLAYTDFAVIHPIVASWEKDGELFDGRFQDGTFTFRDESFTRTGPNVFSNDAGDALVVGAQTLTYKQNIYVRKAPFDGGVFYMALDSGGHHLTDADAKPVSESSQTPDFEFGMTDSAVADKETGFKPVMIERILGYKSQKWRFTENDEHKGYYRISPLGSDNVLTFSRSDARFNTHYVDVPIRYIEVEQTDTSVAADRRKKRTVKIEVQSKGLTLGGTPTLIPGENDVVEFGRHITVAPPAQSPETALNSQLFRVMQGHDGTVYLQSRTSVLRTVVPRTAFVFQTTGRQWEFHKSAESLANEVISVQRIAPKFEDRPGTIRIDRAHAMTTSAPDNRYLQRFRLLPAPESIHRPNPIEFGELADRMGELADRRKMFHDLSLSPGVRGEVHALPPVPGTSKNTAEILKAFNAHVADFDISTAGTAHHQSFEDHFYNASTSAAALERIFDSAWDSFKPASNVTTAEIEAVKRHLNRLMIYRANALELVERMHDTLQYYRIEALQAFAKANTILGDLKQGDEPCGGSNSATKDTCSVFLRGAFSDYMMDEWLPEFLTVVVPAAVAPTDTGVSAGIVSTIKSGIELVETYQKERRLDEISKLLDRNAPNRAQVDYAKVYSLLDDAIRNELNSALNAVRTELKANMLFDPTLLEEMSKAMLSINRNIEKKTLTIPGRSKNVTLDVAGDWAAQSDAIARSLERRYIKALLPARAAVLGFASDTGPTENAPGDRKKILNRFRNWIELNSLRASPLSKTSRLNQLGHETLLGGTISSLPVKVGAQIGKLPKQYRVMTFHLVARPANANFKQFTPGAMTKIRSALGASEILSSMAGAMRIACDLRWNDNGGFREEPDAQGNDDTAGHWVPMPFSDTIRGFGDLTRYVGVNRVGVVPSKAIPPVTDSDDICDLMQSDLALPLPR